jgi:hypothetical protein
VLTDEIALALAPFFDRIGPSHDEISMLVRRAGFVQADPMRAGEQIGKMKRVRTILTHPDVAANPMQADSLVRAFVDALRSNGSFVRGGTPEFPGEPQFQALRRAFVSQGYELTQDGHLLPRSLDALQGVELSKALEAYVVRSLQGAEDGALLIGNGKDLVEATARHALEQCTGSYPVGSNFDATLWQTFDRLDLMPLDPAIVRHLDPNPDKAIQQLIYALALVANKKRNHAGTGHGRPHVANIGAAHASRFYAQVAGLVSRLILDQLDEFHRKNVA